MKIIDAYCDGSNYEDGEVKIDVFDIDEKMSESQIESVAHEFIGKLRDNKIFKKIAEHWGFILKSEIPQKTEEVVVADTYYYFNVYTQCVPISIADVKEGKVKISIIDEIVGNEKRNNRLMVSCQVPEALQKQIDIRKRQLNKIEQEKREKKKQKEIQKAKQILQEYDCNGRLIEY